jgi:hypothetical protein
MKPLPSVLLALAVIAVAAGCASPASRLGDPAYKPTLEPLRKQSWPDTGTTTTPHAMERETRYYVEEQGIRWDDRGTRQPAMSAGAL